MSDSTNLLDNEERPDTQVAWSNDESAAGETLSVVQSECEFYRTILDTLLQDDDESTEVNEFPKLSIPSKLPSNVKKRLRHYRTTAKGKYDVIYQSRGNTSSANGDGETEEFQFLVKLVEKLSDAAERDVIPDKFKIPKIPRSCSKDTLKVFRKKATCIVDILRQLKSTKTHETDSFADSKSGLETKTENKSCQTSFSETVYEKPSGVKSTTSKAVQTMDVRPDFNPSLSGSFTEKIRNSRLSSTASDQFDDDDSTYIAGVDRSADLNLYIDNLEDQLHAKTCRITELEQKLKDLMSGQPEVEKKKKKTKPEIHEHPPPYQLALSMTSAVTDEDRKKLRISETACQRAKSANPRLQDTSDKDRATLLGEKFGVLFNVEWVDAFSYETETLGKSEKDAIFDLLDVAKSILQMCVRLSEEQLDEWRIQLNLGGRIPPHLACVDREPGADTDAQLRDILTQNAQSLISKVRNEILTDDTFQSFYGKEIASCPEFVAHCVDIFWLARTRKPPMHLEFNIDRGMSFKKEYFDCYTKVGTKADFLVWPALFLYESGPLVHKGVLQPVPDKR